MPTYKAYNGPAPTTASQVAVTTGTAIKTLLQVATPAGIYAKLRAWGISFDGSAAATPIIVELVETDVAATVTAHVAAGLIKNNTGDPASSMTLGTAATGYTGSAEGTITATRNFDVQEIQPYDRYSYEWALGNEPVVAISKFLRVRVKAAAAVNAICWVQWDE
jgi:hypothetical protein